MCMSNCRQSDAPLRSLNSGSLNKPMLKKKEESMMAVQKTPQREEKSEQPAAGARKPWKKKTPAEFFDERYEKLRAEVEKEERALEEKKEQLKKFEEARKFFET